MLASKLEKGDKISSNYLNDEEEEEVSMKNILKHLWHYLVVPPLIQRAKHLENPNKEIDYTIATYEFIHRLAAELVGTTLLVTGLGANGAEAGHGYIPSSTAAFNNGLIFVALIYSLAGVSGAHFNPVVTLAFTCRLVFPITWVPFYLLAQFTGSIIAGLLLRALFGGQYAYLASNAVNHNNISLMSGFKWEVFLTFLLIFIILQTATKSKLIGSEAAIAVAAVSAFCFTLGASTSSGSLNPFRSLGPAIINSSSDHNSSLWIFIVAPLLGGLIAVFVVGFIQGMRPKTKEEIVGAHGVEHQQTTNQLRKKNNPQNSNKH